MTNRRGTPQSGGSSPPVTRRATQTFLVICPFPDSLVTSLREKAREVRQHAELFEQRPRAQIVSREFSA